MDALAKLKESIKKFLGVTTETAPPAAVSKEEALRLVELVKLELEKQTGKKMVVLHVGLVGVKPSACQCVACKLRSGTVELRGKVAKRKKSGGFKINPDDSRFAFVLLIVFAIVILAMLWARFR